MPPSQTINWETKDVSSRPGRNSLHGISSVTNGGIYPALQTQFMFAAISVYVYELPNANMGPFIGFNLSTVGRDVRLLVTK